MSERQRTRGFTLVELMVAIGIFLLFMASVYGVYHAASSSVTRAEEQEELYQTGRIIMAQLNAELASAYQPATSQTCELVGNDTEDETEDGFQADRLTFMTTAHTTNDEIATGDISRVVYTLGNEDAGESTGLYVEENFTPGLEATDETPEAHLLSPLVVGVNYKYLPVEGDWELEWVDQTTQPMAVRIELTLRGTKPGAKPLVLISTVNLAMATAPAATEGEGDAQ